MDPYDSDSTLEEEGDYTETGVLLGYASEEVLDDTISHLGGWPTWLDESTPPPGDFANCKVCNQPMLLLLELNGDLPEFFPEDERRLYIFGCPRKACNHKPGSIRALRATRKFKVEVPESKKDKKDNETTRQQPEKSTVQDLGASLFGTNSLTGSLSANPNPFSSSSSPFSAAQTNQFTQAGKPTKEPEPASTSKSASPLADTTTATLPETFAEKVRLTEPEQERPTSSPKSTEPSPPSSKPWPPRSSFPTPYPNFYLDAEYETISRPPTPSIPENVTIENPEEENDGGAGPSKSNKNKTTEKELKDAFESDLDKAFIRFSSRLAHNPEQILRYEFGGSPLLYSFADRVAGCFFHPDDGVNKVTTTTPSGNKMPPCEYCGGRRVFELQLVPHAITVLEEARDRASAGSKGSGSSTGTGAGIDGMEWGTIILGVCSRDCAPGPGPASGSGEVGVTVWREEWAGVQWEEMR